MDPVGRYERKSVWELPKAEGPTPAAALFSRLRCAEIGIYHCIAGDYLGSYAAEMAWREDTRRAANQYAMAVSAAGVLPKS